MDADVGEIARSDLMAINYEQLRPTFEKMAIELGQLLRRARLAKASGMAWLRIGLAVSLVSEALDGLDPHLHEAAVASIQGRSGDDPCREVFARSVSRYLPADRMTIPDETFVANRIRDALASLTLLDHVTPAGPSDPTFASLRLRLLCSAMREINRLLDMPSQIRSRAAYQPPTEASLAPRFISPDA